MACKWVGPGRWLPALALGFGALTISFAFVRTIEAACAVRFLLGALEAGVLPGIAYYLSRWYTRSELVFRLCMYIVMGPIAGAFGGLLASAILKLDHFGSTKRWEMIFAIEGKLASPSENLTDTRRYAYHGTGYCLILYAHRPTRNCKMALCE